MVPTYWLVLENICISRSGHGRGYDEAFLGVRGFVSKCYQQSLRLHSELDLARAYDKDSVQTVSWLGQALAPIGAFRIFA